MEVKIIATQKDGINLWQNTGTRVFDNARPCIQEVLQAVSTESTLWCSVGARKLQELLVRTPTMGV
jgi:hypothetical protein